MRNKTFLHDIRYGISANFLKYIIAVFYFSVLNINFFSHAGTSTGQQINPSMMDSWIYNFKGIGIYDPSLGQPFPIPFTWLILQALLAFLIMSYPTQDLYSHGIQILLRTKNRTVWFLSKCTWVTLTVILFYALGFLTTCCFSIFYGNYSFLPTDQMSRDFLGIELSEFSTAGLLFITIFLPMLISLALSFMQMAISFLMTPLYGYIIIITYALIAAYYCSPLFIANFSMPVRNEGISPNGLSSVVGLFAAAVFIVLSIFMGLCYFKRCDILKKQ